MTLLPDVYQIDSKIEELNISQDTNTPKNTQYPALKNILSGLNSPRGLLELGTQNPKTGWGFFGGGGGGE